MLLERANADILLAQYAISPEGNPTNDEYMIDMTAFHVQQTIEKTLKYVLQTKAGIDEETKLRIKCIGKRTDFDTFKR